MPKRIQDIHALVQVQKERPEFWRRVLKWCLTKPYATNQEACVLFTGSANPRNGYGSMGFWHDGQRQQVYVHRLFFVMGAGRNIHPDKEIDHTCRNRTCVNPRHLREVDHTQNMRYIYKGR